MKKILKLTLILAFGLSLAFTGCKKYEEGPMFSLASKKARVVNIWKVEKVIENGQVVTSLMLLTSSWEFKEDNTFVITNGTFTDTGTWDFDSKKENLLFTITGSSTVEEVEILKLKSDEFWFKIADGTDTEEYHLVTK